jgi:CBS domain-containing protein
MKCAGELMLPLTAFPYIPYWFTLRQALAEIENTAGERGAHGHLPWAILVFSAQNQLLGIVRLRDILTKLKPGPAGKLRNVAPLPEVAEDPNLQRLSFSPEKALGELRNQGERQIIDFMTPIRETVDAGDFALLAINLMIDRNLTYVPVVKDGQIVGIIYAEDVLQEVMAGIV